VARRSAGLVAAVAALALTLFAGGCGAITELVRLQQRVEDAGYSVDGIFHDDFSGGASEVQIDASSGDDGQPPPDGQEEIAEIVWTTYPRRFDTVFIELDGDQVRFTRGDLQEQFGPRPESLDEHDFGDDVATGVRAAAWYGVVVLVLGAVAIVTTLVVLRRRRRAQPDPGPGPAGWPGSGSWDPAPGSVAWAPPAPPAPPAGPPPGWSPPGGHDAGAGAPGPSGYPPPTSAGPPPPV